MRRPSISTVRTPRKRAASSASRRAIISSRFMMSVSAQVARREHPPAARPAFTPQEARRGRLGGVRLCGRIIRLGPRSALAVLRRDLGLEVAPGRFAPAVDAGDPGGGPGVDAAVQDLVALAQLLPFQALE